ncbi:retropepsin-like aspartic protease [Nocardia sp. NPDC049526]|uniref:retropepsin-like aspartic protease n=1 Tax=Nocardia sp. NPDC049526 TaxID=3364316 RepID=UPI0037971E3B
MLRLPLSTAKSSSQGSEVTIQVDFDYDEPSSSGVPRTEVVLFGPAGPSRSSATFSQALVDTGALHTQLPSNVAVSIGLDPLNSGQPIVISTAAGKTQRWLMNVDLKIQGTFVRSVPVYFAPRAVDLVGRTSIYAAYGSTGFESTRWLRKQ